MSEILHDGTSPDSFKSATPSDVLAALSGPAAGVEAPAADPSETPTEADYEDMAMDDPRILANAQRIQEARDAGHMDRADLLVRENKALMDTIVIELKQGRGDYKSPEEVEMERQNTLGEIKRGLPQDPTDEELLRAYGLMGEDGLAHIDSPLFRETTRRAFGRYISFVERFMAASQIEEFGGLRIKDMDKSNRDRREAHDLTAEMVARDLGIDFQAARGLVDKIREDRIPGTSEKATYTVAVRRAMRDMERSGGYLGDMSAGAVSSLMTLNEANKAENGEV